MITRVDLVLRAVLALLVVAVVGAAVYQYGEHRFNKGRAACEAAWAKERLQAAERYAEAAAKLRTAELALEQRKEQAQNVRTKERVRTVAAVAAGSADLDRLRDEISQYAVGVAAAEDSLAAARERAETAGRLLEAALRAGHECAADAENLAADVRQLRAAWPVSDSP